MKLPKFLEFTKSFETLPMMDEDFSLFCHALEEQAGISKAQTAKTLQSVKIFYSTRTTQKLNQIGALKGDLL